MQTVHLTHSLKFGGRLLVRVGTLSFLHLLLTDQSLFEGIFDSCGNAL